MAGKTDFQQFDFDQIEIGKQIGGGGIGLIHEGWIGTQPIALKTFFDPRVSDQLKQEFMDELMILSSLRHDNIIRFLGACLETPHLCFAMELCKQSVFELLQSPEGRRLTLRQRLHMARDTANAMHYLHTVCRPGIIHRDLKTHNLLMKIDGTVCLCDFGLVRTRRTTSGTPNYMAPELLNNRSFNRSVDVYAFGIVLHEIFLDGYDFVDIQRKVQAGERPAIHALDTPVQVKRLMRQCWAHEPPERPTFERILGELDEILHTLPGAEHKIEDSQVDVPPCWRRMRWIVCSLLIEEVLRMPMAFTGPRRENTHQCGVM